MVVRKSVAGIWNLFYLNARVQTVQLSCRFQRNNCAHIANDEQNGDAGFAYELAIVGVGRRQNFKRIDSGLQSGVSQEFDDFR